MSRIDAGAAATTTGIEHDVAISPAMRAATYSVVIPVFNSEAIVGTTIDRTISFFRQAGLDVEIICVNDGSRDGSWSVISSKAEQYPDVVAIDLLRNYGQHNANLCGLRAAGGDWVVTMDDDLQNPPDQALLLIDTAMHGHDVVFGKFDHKKAAGYRKLGSKAISMINRRIFGQPPDLAISNFRILRRDVVDRICGSRTAHPYITGQSLMYSRNRAHVPVRHDQRAAGKSNYNFFRIARLVLTILFSYSSYPLRLAAMCGFAFAGLSFLLGAVYLIRGMVSDAVVEGWMTLAVLLAIFNGVTIALLSMLGEYVTRTLNAVSAHETYHVSQRVPN